MYYPIKCTSIRLTPKIEGPLSIKDFRPISCCNITYKVISKILAIKLKSLPPDLVDENQSTFVKERNIQDNILLMHEIVKNYQKLGVPGRCAIKVDIMKAFDTVRWDYLMSILDSMNIPPKLKKWIYLCISTASFSINLNGSLIGNFTSSRGLRQGDPLSPYLFILVMEGFTQLLKDKIRPSTFQFHDKCNTLSIASLAFADDLFIL